MNQNHIANHSKLKNEKIPLPTNQNKIRSVFSDVSNLEFSTKIIQEKRICNKIEEQQQYQMTKRRNAIIPCIQKFPAFFNYTETKTKTYKIRQCSILEKSMLSYHEVYYSEIQQFERDIEQKKQEGYFDIKQHCFTEKQLEKALDWMIYQIIRFKNFSYESLFKTIELIYLYLSKSQQVKFEDLELISGCCIYLSSKTVDLNPIYIDDLINEVLECRFDYYEVLRQEKLICQTLNFNLFCTCSLQIVYRIMQEINSDMEQLYDSGKIDNLRKQILDNLLLMEFGNKFRQISKGNRAVSCILLTMMENKIDKRVVIIQLLFNVLSGFGECKSFRNEHKLDREECN
ncbi:unnamed protein product (macronuclear) [Paramecium tetraurelia]|uniref:Cyclin N-terminal domain-containing protein n=1 Tax=Paramecium tetraurelia TaxID=5888 RepID=A0D1L6_PARTE|nr:uncharacterized protein GSPATT00012457001 [Paramecium tetraurelia]CAK76933.1 unnamed protein product [Paramecium tetraurelia]|eukprot:XP_001444330.1 hypothetical protein (macronuclear) [Paramecium tetraurelia strain d4-2]